MVTDKGFMPTNVNSRALEPAGTFIVYFPFTSEIAPIFEAPATTTFTPGIVDPSSADVTRPEMVRSWAKALPITARIRINVNNRFFLIVINFRIIGLEINLIKNLIKNLI